MNIRYLFYSFFCLVLLLLGACSTPAPTYTSKPYVPTTPPAPTEAQQLADMQQKAVQTLLQQVSTATSPEREFYQLQAAYLLAEQRQTTEAQQLLMQINVSTLPPENQYLYELVSIDILRQQGQITAAGERLEYMEVPAQTNTVIQIIALELKANLYADQGDNVASAQERTTLQALLTEPTAQKYNQQQIQALTGTAPTVITEAVPYNYKPVKGAEEIALLLPLSGKLAPNAASIRDGFFTAYNAGQTQQNPPLNIKVYDTQDDQNAAIAYEKAVKEGAELIIGPLTKAGVDQINKLNRLPAPVIALNDAHQANQHKRELFEFGLAPEDEARAAANYAFLQGKRQALVLTQADEWGRRVSQAFVDEWQVLGGKIASRIVFEPTNKVGQLIRQGLRINLTAEQKDDSNKQPHIRSDVDMIFLAAYPNTARQIKPLLDFYYASHIKVYGTSSIYALPPDISLDKDLNGVAFCDMPWLIAPEKAEPQLHATIDELWPTTAQAYARFYALGVDAYHLTTQIHHLQTQRLYPMDGVTGKLTLTNNSRIAREVMCTQFQQGTPSRL